MDIQELDQQMAARRASSRQPKPTSRALEGAEQEHLKFNARCTPGQLEKERREQQAERAAAAKRARKSKDQWVPAEGDLVWAHYDGWYDHYSAWREVAHALPCSSCWLTCLTPPACAFEHRPWWPATLTDAEARPWRDKIGGQYMYNCEFLGHGDEEVADYAYLPVAELRQYSRWVTACLTFSLAALAPSVPRLYPEACLAKAGVVLHISSQRDCEALQDP
jgi:hypothetical protein